MSDFVVKQLDSVAQLQAQACEWDSLWERSEIALPTCRAALIAAWCESFAAGQPFRAFVVEHDGRTVAALPLVESRWKGLKVGALPGNEWSPCGDLLLDPACDGRRACAALLAALEQGPWPLLCFGGVPSTADRWRVFFESLGVARMPYARRLDCLINRVEIADQWDAYLNSRSRNHRHHVRKAAKRAERAGLNELSRYDRLTPDEVEPLLKACFELELSGWKGDARSAVFNVPGVWEFYLRQARQLATWGQLSLTLLEHQGRPIAFEYGWRSKGVYFSPKVGYDEAFSRFSPGQLLRYRLLEAFHHDSDPQWVDFLGPTSPATSKWATEQYLIDQIVVATRGRISRAIVAGYRTYTWLSSLMASHGDLHTVVRQDCPGVGDQHASPDAWQEAAPTVLD